MTHVSLRADGSIQRVTLNCMPHIHQERKVIHYSIAKNSLIVQKGALCEGLFFNEFEESTVPNVIGTFDTNM